VSTKGALNDGKETAKNDHLVQTCLFNAKMRQLTWLLLATFFEVETKAFE